MRRFLHFCLVLFTFGVLIEAKSSIYSGSEWLFKKGTSPASDEPLWWCSVNFDDSSWNTGTTPFFYGEPLQGTVLDDMFGSYTSVYLRKSFCLDRFDDIVSFELKVLSDDGCIVWINGVEVMRFNMPAGDVPYNSVALPPLPEPILWQTRMVDKIKDYLKPGTNVIAIHAFNSSLDQSSDFVIDCELIFNTRELIPYITNINPIEKSIVKNLSYIEVFFSEDVNGVDSSDLLINGIPSTSVNQITPSHYIFTFPAVLPGEVIIQWRNEHNISDENGNLFRGGSWTYFVNPEVNFGVIISEVMAANNSTIRDEDGDYSDWIEIANLSDLPVDLNGWTLTDNIKKPFKWRFPQIILNPGDYLLVFASEKNRANSAGQLHTSFSLDKDGEFVGLFNSSSNYIDGLNLPPLQDDQSYGKMEENTNIFGFCLKPTPGKKNSSIGYGFSPDTLFSMHGGTFKAPFYLQISTTSTNAVIYYSTDGGLPCIGSPIFNQPLLITTDRVWIVKAYSVEPGKLPSKINTQIYVPLAFDMTNFASTLPIVVIEKKDNYPFSCDEYQEAYILIYNTGSMLANASPAGLITKSKIKIRGTTSSYQPKTSFAVEWIDEDENELDLKTLGMPEDSEWVLYAPNNYDTPLIHNAFMYDLSNQIGRYAPRYRFVELFIHNNTSLSSSNYYGIYLLVEKIKRGSDRVDINKLEPEFDSEPEITGGYIFRKDWLDQPEDIFNAGGQTLNYVYPDGEEISKPERSKQKEYLTSYLDSFYNVLYSENFTDPTNGYNAYIDVDSWIDFHLLNTLAFNVDALNLSTYFYKPRNGKISCGPIWDFDRSMDSRDDPRDDNPFTWWTNVDFLGHNYFGFTEEVWWSRLFQDPDFWQKYIDRYQALRCSAFSTSNLFQLITTLSGRVKEAQPREFRRWGNFTAPRNNSYEYEIQYMKEWISNRVTFLDSNFLRQPILSTNYDIIPAGFIFEVDPSDSETIYFTTDGTDPRLRGGKISPTAQVLKNRGFVVGRSMIFVARAYNPSKYTTIIENQIQIQSPWSSPVIAKFTVIPGTVSKEDSDGDGMPDWWESESGLDYLSADGNDGAFSDPDDDGLSNLQEYLADSKPLDAGNPLFFNFNMGSNNFMRVNFKAFPMRTYSILYSSNPVSTRWQTLLDIPPVNQEMNITIDITKPENKFLFYRLIYEIVH